jgi:c-di-GMP-binding flagellar brake protein YcgR
MPERREFVRFEIDQMVELRYERENFIRADGIDLSEKGMLCVTDDPVEPHTRMFLMFRLPIRHEVYEVKCEGVVLRSMKKGKKYEVAVHFTDLAPAERKAIEAYAKIAIQEQEAAAKALSGDKEKKKPKKGTTKKKGKS